jgi:Mannosylglycerate hydrolase MGH1-like glycoside hydrolase domain
LRPGDFLALGKGGATLYQYVNTAWSYRLPGAVYHGPSADFARCGRSSFMRIRSAALSIVGLALICACLSPAQPPSTYAYTGKIALNPAKVPFSRFGSYLAFTQVLPDSPFKLPPGLYLRSMRDGDHAVFRLELLAAGAPVPFQIHSSPILLRLEAQAGSVEICIPQDDRIRLRGQGVSLRLTAVTRTVAVPNANSHWEINTPPSEKYMLWPIAGTLSVDAPWNGHSTMSTVATFIPAPATHRFEAEIDNYVSVWTPHAAGADFAASEGAVQRDYQHWLTRMPEVPAAYGPGAELAAYIDWASVVAPSGYFKYPAMLMSKNWMDRLWSWDHCFNAMALAYKDPALAWQQFEIPFDNQDPHGALPDTTGNESVEFSYTKPPIHGWALMWMIQNAGFRDPKHLAAIYEPLSRWTNWFFTYRDSNSDGLPEYDHGNDSGWDNSTVMLSGIPVESPDLDAFLILQMDALASIAHSLNKE